MAGFGINGTLIEFGNYSNDWAAVPPGTFQHCPPTMGSVSRPRTGPTGAAFPVTQRRPGTQCFS